MKLYEVTSKAPDLSAPVLLCETCYFTSKQAALVWFRMAKKLSGLRWVRLSQCTVRIDLKAEDWCMLLEADAPGMTCELTPQDLVIESILLATFTPKEAAA